MNNKNYFNAMKTSNKQGGWTMWSLIISLGLVIFFGYIIMQLIPVYTGHANLKNSMEVALDNSGNPRTMSKNTFIRALQKQLYLDGAHESIDYKNDVEFKRSKKDITVSIDYDRIVPLFYNISLMVDFDESISRSF